MKDAFGQKPKGGGGGLQYEMPECLRAITPVIRVDAYATFDLLTMHGRLYMNSDDMVVVWERPRGQPKTRLTGLI